MGQLLILILSLRFKPKTNDAIKIGFTLASTFIFTSIFFNFFFLILIFIKLRLAWFLDDNTSVLIS